MLEPTWLIIAEPEMCRNALPTLQSSITGTYQARHWLPPQADQWCFSTAPRSAAHWRSISGRLRTELGTGEPV
jgi:hypothetical protein